MISIENNLPLMRVRNVIHTSYSAAQIYLLMESSSSSHWKGPVPLQGGNPSCIEFGIASVFLDRPLPIANLTSWRLGPEIGVP